MVPNSVFGRKRGNETSELKQLAEPVVQDSPPHPDTKKRTPTKAASERPKPRPLRPASYQDPAPTSQHPTPQHSAQGSVESAVSPFKDTGNQLVSAQDFIPESTFTTDPRGVLSGSQGLSYTDLYKHAPPTPYHHVATDCGQPNDYASGNTLPVGNDFSNNANNPQYHQPTGFVGQNYNPLNIFDGSQWHSVATPGFFSYPGAQPLHNSTALMDVNQQPQYHSLALMDVSQPLQPNSGSLMGVTPQPQHSPLALMDFTQQSQLLHHGSQEAWPAPAMPPFGMGASAAEDNRGQGYPVHECTCGDACGCLACPVHPYNHATRMQALHAGRVLQQDFLGPNGLDFEQMESSYNNLPIMLDSDYIEAEHFFQPSELMGQIPPTSFMPQTQSGSQGGSCCH